LTPAEWKVVQAVRHGLTNAEIARRRNISLDAVKNHVASAVAKLGLPDRRALRLWRGAPRDSALGQVVTTSGRAGITGVGQIARTVADAPRAEAWYRDVLGLTHLYTYGTLVFFDCGSVRLMLTQQESLTPESILYLRVDDIHAACDRLRERNVEFLTAPHMIHTHADGTEEWMAFFKDPEERPLALMAQVGPGASSGDTTRRVQQG
jgi:catechol 2,3-dioxygenase-like lactoylglutathione lyase family enzyme